VKDFFELREAKVSAQFTDHTPDKDFNNLAKKHKVKVTHDKNDEKTTIHGDEKAVLSVLKTMYGNDWKDMYTKKGSVYVDESVVMNEQFVVKYAKNKRGPIYQTKFSSQGEAEKFLAQKKKEGMNGIVSKAGKPVSMQKMKDLQKESVELGESVDFMKMSKELLKHKSKGIEFEKAAAYVRAIHNNSNVNVQDKAFMGLIKMLKDMDDFTKRTTITKILKDNGFKVRGGKLMRESVELDEVKLSDMGIHNKIKDRNLLIKAIKTAEKMGGNMTGAVREIEKMQKGLSKHKAVQAALRQANESVE